MLKPLTQKPMRILQITSLKLKMKTTASKPVLHKSKSDLVR